MFARPLASLIAATSLVAVLAVASGAAVSENAVRHADGASAVVTHRGRGPILYPNQEAGAPGGFARYNTVHLKVTPRGCRSDVCTRTIVAHNARTSAGAVAIAQDIGGTPVAAFNYIALSTDSTAVANGDTTCPSEITGSGLARKQATTGTITAPTTLGGTASYTLTATWTATAATTVTKICALNAASSGTLGFELVLGSSVALNSGDSLSLTYAFQT